MHSVLGKAIPLPLYLLSTPDDVMMVRGVIVDVEHDTDPDQQVNCFQTEVGEVHISPLVSNLDPSVYGDNCC